MTPPVNFAARLALLLCTNCPKIVFGIMFRRCLPHSCKKKKKKKKRSGHGRSPSLSSNDLVLQINLDHSYRTWMIFPTVTDSRVNSPAVAERIASDRVSRLRRWDGGRADEANAPPADGAAGQREGRRVRLVRDGAVSALRHPNRHARERRESAVNAGRRSVASVRFSPGSTHWCSHCALGWCDKE